MKKLKQNSIMILFCLGISFLFLLVCSKTSFLYAFHDWFDSNAFMTVGRGMRYGLVPYRDLFEQKGPILYLLHMLASFISEKDFLGVWFFQIISFAVFLFYSSKIISLYLPKKTSYYLLPLFAFFVLMMRSYRYGDSAEEFALPLLTIGLYHLLFYLKQKQEMPLRLFLLHSIFAGVILWIKYSLLGFWFGFMLFFLIDTIQKKNYLLALKRSVVFLSGMTLSTVPVFLYFGIHHSISDLFHVYFMVNMQSYTVALSPISYIKWLYETFFSKIIQENIFGICILLGFVFMFQKQGKRAGFAFFTCFLFLLLSVYGGGRAYSYYFLIFAPIGLFGLIYLYQHFKKKHTVKTGNVILLIVATFFLAYQFQHNTVDLGKTKEDYAQYQFAEIINQKVNATVLNYGFLDGGFYLASQTLPTNFYFQKNNIPYQQYPEMMDHQNEAIKNKEVDFVILLIKPGMTIYDIDNVYLLRNYKIITVHQQKIEGCNQTYYLLEKK